MIRPYQFVLLFAIAATLSWSSFSSCDRAPARGANASNQNNASHVTPASELRVISIAPNATEIIFALGAADRLVGVSDFCRLPASQDELPRVGGLIDPNLERILLLKPNLIIARGKMREVEKLCEANQIALYHDPTESYNDIFRTIRELGDLLNRHEQAVSLTQKISKRVDRVTERIAGKKRPRVLFTTDRPIDSLARVTTCGRNTFVDEIITRAGGENVFGRVDVAYPEVSLESILVARPEVIIEVMPSQERNVDELAEHVRAQWRKLGSMPATTNGRIHVFTDADLVIPSPRIADSIERLAAILHPEVNFD